MTGCPLGIDIPGFIRLLRESDAAAALERIKLENPFPAICGRICSAPCESACVFNDEGSPIAIRALERYASDFGSKPSGKTKIVPQFSDKKVAIIGSGPSAMMAASILLKEKIKVVMFEAGSEAGGILRYGVPEFRLPKNILAEQFEQLFLQGLELHTDILVGRIKPLQELINAFDAVLIAVGASLPNFSTLKGENLAGVYYAQEFLTHLQMISKENILSPKKFFKGSNTIILGAGYAALDAARLAIRLGQQVDLMFEGLEEEMGVPPDMLKEALDEGVKIHAPFEAIDIEGDTQGLVQCVKSRRLEISELNGSLSLVPSSDDPQVFPAQTIVIANEAHTNLFLAKEINQLKINEQGSFWVEPGTFKTSLEKVFAVGNAVKSSSRLIEAFADGKAVARKIIESLNS